VSQVTERLWQEYEAPPRSERVRGTQGATTPGEAAAPAVVTPGLRVADTQTGSSGVTLPGTVWVAVVHGASASWPEVAIRGRATRPPRWHWPRSSSSEFKHRQTEGDPRNRQLMMRFVGAGGAPVCVCVNGWGYGNGVYTAFVHVFSEVQRSSVPSFCVLFVVFQFPPWSTDQ
jgi:hypothetical protein